MSSALHSFTIRAQRHSVKVRILRNSRDLTLELGPHDHYCRTGKLAGGYFDVEPKVTAKTLGTIALAANCLTMETVAHEACHAAHAVSEQEERIALFTGLFTQKIAYKLLSLGYEL